ADKIKPVIVVVAILGVAAYFVYRHLRKPVVEGSPKEMPPVVGQVTTTVETAVEKTVEKVMEVKDKILHTGASSPDIKVSPPPCLAPPPMRRPQARSSTTTTATSGPASPAARS